MKKRILGQSLLKQPMNLAVGFGVALSASWVHANSIVDIMVVYDTAAEKDVKGGIETYINQVVSYSNTAFQSSDMNIRLRLVHTVKMDVPGVDGVTGSGLDSFTENQSVGNLREQYGADLVAMLTPASGGTCGIAWLGSGDDGKFYRGAGQNAYSLSGSNCGALTFAHEIGHNLGLSHSRAQGDEGGVFDYGLGHGENGRFATIMAYSHVYGVWESLDYFSNPRLNLCEGRPCGLAEGNDNSADAAKAINQTASQSAQWQPTKVDDDDAGPTEPTDPTEPDNGSGGDNNGDDNGDSSNPGSGDDGGDPPYISVTNITLPENLYVEMGTFFQLNPEISPSNATNQKITFFTDNSEIADVSNSGVITAKAFGNTVVTAVTDDGNWGASVNVYIEKTQPDSSGGAMPFYFGLASLLTLAGFRRSNRTKKNLKTTKEN